ncbi:hypothetical protein GZH53_09940 [Flavihumibacter sp. R14]|nr:hypothetical protein [Flavihumibacter soli]
MTTYELTNPQREYFGLDPIEKHWDKVAFKGDTYRPDSFLYFEGNTIKRHIISTENKYYECHYDELTKDRTILLPKTSKGKEKKLTGSVLERRQPIGIYLNVTNYGDLLIGNYSTETTFYSSRWDNLDLTKTKSISDIVDEFIKQSPENHLKQIDEYKNAKRKNIRFKSGDYFCFKLSRTKYGFGRVLLDINKLRKKQLISKEHGLNLLMGMPVFVQLFAYSSDKKKVDISQLDNYPKLPTDVMMDNILLYGEYEVIGHRDLKEEDFEFPISYGRSIDHQRQVVFLQWGLIHKELPTQKFNKFTVGDNPFVAENSYSRKVQNPFGFYSIGFRPHYETIDILQTIANKGVFDFDGRQNFKAEFDLRNPKHKATRQEILKTFGLDPDKNYTDNCKLTGTEPTTEILRLL